MLGERCRVDDKNPASAVCVERSRADRLLLPLPVAAFLCFVVATGDAKAQQVRFQPAETVTILSTEDMQGTGLLFPDEPLEFIRASNGRYAAFAAGVSTAGLGPGPQVVPNGTYKFMGTLDHLVPANMHGRWPAYSLTKGSTQPSPDGRNFDRDYGGGGPIYLLPGSSALLEIYHGEYHCAPPAGLPAYGGSGMAVSRDGGNSFTKIGEILSPHVSQNEFCQSGKRTGFWADGGMIEADANGQRTGTKDAYEYILFVDHNSIEEPYIGISIARASKADVFAAIDIGKAPVFKKYYNPTKAPGPLGQFFSEPGLGGSSSPIIATPKVFIGTPGVAYNSYIRKFIVYYQFNQKHIAFQTSDNLFAWSPPQNVVDIEQNVNLRLFYPSIVGLGADPAVPEKEFYLYYLQRMMPTRNPQLLRTKVVIQ
jgi:hypothetical protein